MKAKLAGNYDENHPKGTEVDIDKIVYDDEYAGKYKVRVVSGFSKNPIYLSINWVVKVPKGKE